MIPVLMITYNRLAYTKRALEALFNSKDVDIYIIDNGSKDGTQEWLLSQPWAVSWHTIFNSENEGIAGAMNKFLQLTKMHGVVGKVDNDTIVPVNWISKLLPALDHCDMVQAKHHIIPATNPDGWDGFTKNMKKEGSLYFNHFIGGSGILFKRSVVDHIPTTKWELGGWRQFQREHPDLIKAFCEDVEIKLLDEHGYTDYPEYYKQTKRA